MFFQHRHVLYRCNNAEWSVDLSLLNNGFVLVKLEWTFKCCDFGSQNHETCNTHVMAYMYIMLELMFGPVETILNVYTCEKQEEK